jgi:hypothetical protein
MRSFMSEIRDRLRLATFVSAMIAASAAVGENVPPGVVALTPDEITWRSQGALAAPGLEQANLVGDPAKPGPYTIRIRFPKGYRIQPHTHQSVGRGDMGSCALALIAEKQPDAKASEHAGKDEPTFAQAASMPGRPRVVRLRPIPRTFPVALPTAAVPDPAWLGFRGSTNSTSRSSCAFVSSPVQRTISRLVPRDDLAAPQKKRFLFGIALHSCVECCAAKFGISI